MMLWYSFNALRFGWTAYRPSRGPMALRAGPKTRLNNACNR